MAIESAYVISGGPTDDPLVIEVSLNGVSVARFYVAKDELKPAAHLELILADIPPSLASDVRQTEEFDLDEKNADITGNRPRRK